MRTAAAIGIVLGAVLLSAALVAAVLDLPAPSIRLPVEVSERLQASGVEHPVTAVLLNFRGYDTLLEIAVLLLALIVVLAVVVADATPAATSRDEPVLQTGARLAAPVMLLVALYLLWAGAYRPGGAFQAGAVLAAVAVLFNLAGVAPGWARPRWPMRFALAGGHFVFLAVAVAMLAHGHLLQYPSAAAGALILLIESALTVSLGTILAGLLLFLRVESA